MLTVKNDKKHMAQAIRTLFRRGDTFEVRALEVAGYGTSTQNWSGYFLFDGTNENPIAEEIGKLGPAVGIYATLNPVAAELRARSNNRMTVAKNGSTTGDADIVKLAYLLIDIDPVRKTKTSATDAQVAKAKAVAERVYLALKEKGWPDPVVIFSGNGLHLRYRIDLPCERSRLLKQALEALGAMFDGEDVKIDKGVFNPSRIARLPGTVARKGDEVPEMGIRHRLAEMAHVPAELRDVPLHLLEDLAAQACQPVALDLQNRAERGAIVASTGQEWLDHWCGQHDPDALSGFRPYGSGGRLARVECPWNSGHGRDAYLMQMADGAIAAGCHHESCREKRWRDYRATKEPGYSQGNGNPSAACGTVADPPAWTTPVPLAFRKKRELPALDALLIPSALVKYCEDVAFRMQAPIEYVIVTLLVSFAAVLGNRLVIYAKRRDNWRVTVTLWAMIVGEPGKLKTPLVNEVTQFIRAIEKIFQNEYAEQKQTYETLVKSLEKSIKNEEAKFKSKNAATSSQQLESLKGQLDRILANPPQLKRRLVKDTTIEKLQEILAANPQGCWLLWDELAAFFSTLEKAGREMDRGFYLEAWNGLNSYTVDRITRPSLVIDKLCLSILGTIQPEVLAKFARQSMDKHGSDGFLSRFQLVIFPPPISWIYTDESPDPEAQKLVESVTEFLNGWDPVDDPNFSRYRQDKPGEIGVGFDSAAQRLFAEWLTELHRRIIAKEIKSARMEEHLAKFPALMLKLSLIFHCVEYAPAGSIPPEIGELTAMRAISWCEYLEFHAERLYGLDENDNDRTAQIALALLEKIKEGKIAQGMTLNQIVRKDWSGMKNVESVAAAIELLEAQGWVRMAQKGASGRPTQGLEINPQAQAALLVKDRHVKEDRGESRPRPWLERLKNLLADGDADCLAAHLHLRWLDELEEPEDAWEDAGWKELALAAMDCP